jgi:hypothetical protein
MNGYTLQSYIFHDAIRRDIPFGIWMAQQHTLCIFISIFTIFIELFFFVSIIIPRSTHFFLVSALLFQAGLFVVAGHGFFQHMILLTLLLIFIDPEKSKVWLDKLVYIYSFRWRSQAQKAA